MDAPSVGERLRAAMNEARKQREQARTLLLSTILSDLKNRELELNHPASDDEAAEVVRRGIKRRRESVEVYEKAGRADRAATESAEIQILESFLPASVSPEEIRAAVREAIASGGGGGREGHGQDHGRRDAALQGTRGREVGEPNRARGVGRDQMTPEVLETLEFPEALARVAAHAAGPLGAARIAARIAARQPSTDAATIRAALAQVAELAALLITDDSIRAEPVPDITVSLELLDVPGSALEGPALAELTVALAAMRVTAADLKRIGTTHDARRTASLRVDPPPRELETTLVRSIAPDGAVLDSASRDLARARQHVREARKRVMDRLGAILGALDH